MPLALGAKNGLFGMNASSSKGMLDVADLRHPADEARAVLLQQPLLRHRAGGRPWAPSGAPRRARRRAGRAGRTSASRCSRRGRGGRCRGCCRSPCCAGRCCGSAARSACRWSCPRTRRRGSPPCRARCAASRGGWCRGGGGPGRAGCRLRSAPCPGGQPSMTQPMAGPWLSPKLVTRNSSPKVLPDMEWMIGRMVTAMVTSAPRATSRRVPCADDPPHLVDRWRT